MVLSNAKGIAEALIVYDLTLTQELDRITHIRVVGHTKNVVVGDARLLLCCYRANATKWLFQRQNFKSSNESPQVLDGFPGYAFQS